MAGQITHMEVAYRLIGRLGIDEGKAEYILGSVAPDSVHFDEDYLSKKIHSHLFENCGPWGDTQNYDNWIINIKAFWNKYVAKENDNIRKAFYIGIVVHCLTDYWNDLLIWRSLQKEMIPPMSIDEFKEAYYPESNRIDRWLYQNIDDAKPISWVTTTMVMPSSASCFITSRTSPTISGSRAEVGSSKSIISGFMHSERTMAIRCFCPPDKDAG